MPSAQQIIYAAYRDIGGTRPGQGQSTDMLNDCLVALNELVDSWANDRTFIWTYNGFQWIILTAFINLGTTYTLAPGDEMALRKNLAVKILPMLRIYLKIPDPPMEQLEAEAAAARLSIEGIGPPI